LISFYEKWLHDQNPAVWQAFFRTSLLCGFVFSICYYPADWLAENAPQRWQFFMEWERHIPYHPLWFLPYFSAFILVSIIPFHLKSTKEIKSWGKATILAIIIATPFFILLPTQSAHPVSDEKILSEIYKYSILISRHHNLFPSLHVALSFIAIRSLINNSNRKTQKILIAWLAIISASTLLTHQHHLIDIPSGILLGWLCTSLVKRRATVYRKQP